MRCDVCDIANILAPGKLRLADADLRDIASQSKRHVGAWRSLMHQRPVQEHWRRLATVRGRYLPPPEPAAPKKRGPQQGRKHPLDPILSSSAAAADAAAPPSQRARYEALGVEARARHETLGADASAPLTVDDEGGAGAAPGVVTGLTARTWAPCKKCSGAPRPVVVGACDDAAHFVCEHHLVQAVGVGSVEELRARGGTFKCSACDLAAGAGTAAAPKAAADEAAAAALAYPTSVPAPWVSVCGICREPLGADPVSVVWPAPPGGAAHVLGCARCPRAFHERCLGLAAVPSSAARYKHDLPWVDSRGHWLCAACEGVGDSKAAVLDTASAFALSSMKRGASIPDDRAPDDGVGPEPAAHRRAVAGLAATANVVDVLLDHDFGWHFARPLEATADDDDAAAAAAAAAPSLSAIRAALGEALKRTDAEEQIPHGHHGQRPLAAWAAAAAAASASAVDAIRRVRTLWRARAAVVADDAPAVRKMAKELSTLAELGFARCVRLHLAKHDQAHLDDHVRSNAKI